MKQQTPEQQAAASQLVELMNEEISNLMRERRRMEARVSRLRTEIDGVNLRIAELQYKRSALEATGGGS